MTQMRVGKLNIKTQQFLKYLSVFIFVMPFLLSFLLDIVHLPSLIKYTIDVAWVLGIFLLLFKRRVVFDRKLIPFLLFILGFFLYVFIGYIFNFQSIFYFLWGFRNNFRFYFAFLMFCMVFTNDDVKACFKFLDILFWVNAVVSFFQFFVLHYEQDYLGGIFGVEKGCNGYSIAFFSIILAKSILEFMNKKESAFKCFSKCIVALIIAALAELKFFFVIFAIILFMATLMTSFSWRKFILILLSTMLISFASSILVELFGDNNAITFESIIDFASTTNYSSERDISRFTAIPIISNNIMENSMQRLFGLGLGNCDTSAFAICNTPFFETYSYLHYNWFSSALLFLETGFVGLCIYIFFFVMCFVFALKQKKIEDSNELFCQMAMILSIICLTLTFYNGSLRFEVAYMIYFVLALPLIDSRTNIMNKII